MPWVAHAWLLQSAVNKPITRHAVGNANGALTPASATVQGGSPKCKLSRADRIRTCDLFVPNEARYQPALQLAAYSRGHYTRNFIFGKYKIVDVKKNDKKHRMV